THQPSQAELICWCRVVQLLQDNGRRCDRSCVGLALGQSGSPDFPTSGNPAVILPSVPIVLFLRRAIATTSGAPARGHEAAGDGPNAIALSVRTLARMPARPRNGNSRQTGAKVPKCRCQFGQPLRSRRATECAGSRPQGSRPQERSKAGTRFRQERAWATGVGSTPDGQEAPGSKSLAPNDGLKT